MSGVVAMRRSLTGLAFACVCVARAGAQTPARPRAEASAVGTWRGVSVCTVRPSSCNDEVVVYRIAATSHADSLSLDARKLVDGREVEMGVLPCHFVRPDGPLTCPIARGTWRFVVRNDSLVGELRLTDDRRFRDVRTARSP